MGPLSLFELAYQKNEWLAQRQSVIAANVANANTPGYKAKDVESFESMMSNSGGSLAMSTTENRHLSTTDKALEGDLHPVRNPQVLPSGNDVALEDEFMKSGDVMRQFSLNTQVVKAFNRMLLLATKT